MEFSDGFGPESGGGDEWDDEYRPSDATMDGITREKIAAVIGYTERVKSLFRFLSVVAASSALVACVWLVGRYFGK